MPETTTTPETVQFMDETFELFTDRLAQLEIDARKASTELAILKLVCDSITNPRSVYYIGGTENGRWI